jgi:hypothetical protein
MRFGDSLYRLTTAHSQFSHAAALLLVATSRLCVLRQP